MKTTLDKNQKTYANTVMLIEQFMEGALDDKIKEEIRKKGLYAGICMAIPLWGIETIAYIFVLWSTYSKISEISGVPFKENFMKNVLVGFITNIVITFALGCALDFIPVAGWIGSFILGYLSIQLSGMGYVKALKYAHGKNAKLDINLRGGVNAVKSNISVAKPQYNFGQTIDKVSATNSFVDSVKSKDIEGMSNAYHSFIDNSCNDGSTEEMIMDAIPEELPIMQENHKKRPKVVTTKANQETQPLKQSSKINQLRELKSLLDDGILTQEEYDSEKQKVLNT